MAGHLEALVALPESRTARLFRALGLGLCLRCSFRMTGYEAEGLFGLPEVQLQQLAEGLHRHMAGGTPDGLVAPWEAASAVCPLCLGMMQKALLLAEEMVKALKASEYQSPTQFSFSLAMPKAVAVRNVAAVLAVLDPADAGDHCSLLRSAVRQVVDLKDALQMALRDVVGLALQAEYTADKGLTFHVDYDHEAANTGVYEFFRQLPSHLYTAVHKEGPPEQVSISAIKDTFARMLISEFREFCGITPESWAVDSDLTWTLSMTHESLFLIGRYCKWHRKLAQTPWVLNGKRIAATSIQELVGLPLLAFIHPTLDLSDPELCTSYPLARDAGDEKEAKRARPDPELLGCHAKGKAHNSYCNSFVDSLYKFHSCGREDVDVRMLGTGRPFIFEATDPHVLRFTEEELRCMMEAVNSFDAEERVQIHSLHVGSQEEFDELNAQLDKRRKSYRCVVWAARDLSKTDGLLQAINRCTDIVLAQKTPIRVMHRRSLLTRNKVVHTIQCECINAHWLVVDVMTSAGTYVKEFIHGDCGRTVPSLASMLQCRTEIIQLDVTEVL